MRTAAFELVAELARRLEADQGRLVIDADVHISDVAALTGDTRTRYEGADDYYHGRPISAEDAIREMDMAGIDAALVWQNPAATPSAGDRESNAERLLAANRYVLDSALRYPGRFLPAGWLDPKACGLSHTLEMAHTLISEFGFAVVKLNPAQNEYPIDSPEVVEVFDRIVELGAIPAAHFGADTPYTPAAGLRRIVERHPEHPFLAVHMGGGGAGYLQAETLYNEARELGLERPNLRYILSARRDTHTESDLIRYQLAGEPYRHNLMCGSDAPYGRMSWNFGGFRAMLQTLADGARHTDPLLRANPGLFTPGAVQDYLGGNVARLLLAQYRTLFEKGAHAAICS